jgi:hypothetical protein
MRAKIHGLALAGAAALAATLAGCATAPPPVQLVDRAQAEIRAARAVGAAQTAPDTLADAERRLAAAQQFTQTGDNKKAAVSAEEAEAAAATARARATAAQLDDQIRQQTDLNAGLAADLARRQAAAAAAQQAVMAPPAPGSSAALPASPSSAAAPAAASSAGNLNAPVMLPSIQLGPSAPPASAASSAAPAPASTAGDDDTDPEP